MSIKSITTESGAFEFRVPWVYVRGYFYFWWVGTCPSCTSNISGETSPTRSGVVPWYFVREINLFGESNILSFTPCPNYMFTKDPFPRDSNPAEIDPTCFWTSSAWVKTTSWGNDIDVYLVLVSIPLTVYLWYLMLSKANTAHVGTVKLLILWGFVRGNIYFGEIKFPQDVH